MLNDKTLNFTDRLPADWEGYHIPGTEVQSATGAFGKLMVQTAAVGSAMVHVITLQVRSRYHLQLTAVTPRCLLCFSFNVHAFISQPGRDVRQCTPGVFLFGYFPELSASVRIVKSRPSRLLVISYPPKEIASRALSTPALKNIMDGMELNQQSILGRGFIQATGEMVEIGIKMLESSYLPEAAYVHEEYMDQLFESVLAKLSETVTGDTLFTMEDGARIVSAKVYIDRHLDQSLTLSKICEHTGLTSQKLRIGFRQLFRDTIRGYILSRRLDRARDQLELTDKPMKEIAREAGYRKSNNFITAFKRRFGIPPSAYTRRLPESPDDIA